MELVIKSLGSKLTDHKFLIAILLLALGARLSVVFIFSHTILGSRVEKSHIIAENFVEGKGFSRINEAYSEAYGNEQVLYAHGRPFYGFFLVMIYTLFGISWWTVGISQGLLSTFNVFLTYLVGRRLYGRKAGYLAAFFMGLYPYIIFHDVHVNRTVLATTFVLLAAFFSLRLGDHQRYRDAAGLGLAIGAGTLTEGPLMVAIPLLLVWIWWKLEWEILKFVKIAICLGLFAILVASPWAVRNYYIFDQWVFISTDGGRAFWKTHSPSSYMVLTDLKVAADAVAYLDADPVIVRGQQRAGEVEKDQIYYEEAWKFIFDNPKLTLQQMLLNFYSFWHIRITPLNSGSFEEMMTTHFSFGSNFMAFLREWGYTLTYTPLLLLAIYGAYKTFRSSKEDLLLLLAFFATGSVVAMMFSGITRYRIPFDPLLATLAAGGIQVLWRKIPIEIRDRYGKLVPFGAHTAD